MALQLTGSGRIDSSFSDMSISGGGGGFGSSGHGLGVDVESFSSKHKGSCLIILKNSTKV